MTAFLDRLRAWAYPCGPYADFTHISPAQETPMTSLPRRAADSTTDASPDAAVRPRLTADQQHHAEVRQLKDQIATLERRLAKLQAINERLSGTGSDDRHGTFHPTDTAPTFGHEPTPAERPTPRLLANWSAWRAGTGAVR